MSQHETGTVPSWARMRRQDFDESEPLTLFDLTEADGSNLPRKPDKCGTPDLFSLDAEGGERECP